MMATKIRVSKCYCSCIVKRGNSLFIYLFIFGYPGLCCCVGLSLAADSRVYSLLAVCSLLIVLASIVAEHRL